MHFEGYVMRRLLSLLVSVFLIASLSAHSAFAGEEENSRANNAVRVLREIMMAPDKRLPADLMQSAYAIAVIPDVIKAGFVIGGRHGLGLMAVKSPEGTGRKPGYRSVSR